jgi:hypothetical protein
MDIRIEIFKEVNYSPLFGAEVYINNQWFKEIGGLPTVKDVLLALATNEDLLENTFT